MSIKNLVCTDKNLSEKAIDKRIFNYAIGEISENEENESRLHITSCRYCFEQVQVYRKIISGLKIESVYEKLNTAYDNSDWQRVLEINNVLDRLSAPEEIYQRKQLVEQSLKHLK